VFGIDDQQGLVDDLAIGGHLPRQALQGVGSSFDFNAANMAIYHSNIDPAATMIEAKFVDDQGIGTGAGVREQPPIGSFSDITIPKWSRSHADSIATVMVEWQWPMFRTSCESGSVIMHEHRRKRQVSGSN
tara:strand:- start:261 stop:653 length:393 start_codon:yes stop_codon:yes gene_type:complete